MKNLKDLSIIEIGVCIFGFSITFAVFSLDFSPDWKSLFTNLSKKNYNDKYDEAIQYFQNENYELAYEEFVVCENGLKFKVNYSLENVETYIEQCKQKYTDKKIQSMKTYLTTGDDSSLADDDISNNAEIVDEDKKSELYELEKLVSNAKEFQTCIENLDYFHALEIYSENEFGKYGYLLEDMHVVVDKAENNALSKVKEVLEEEDYEMANKLYRLLKQFSSNQKLLNELNSVILASGYIDQLNKDYENEEYLKIVQFITDNEYLLDDESIKQVFYKAVSKYRQEIESQTNELIKENEYDKLKAVLNDALQYIDSDSLKRKLDRYAEYNDKEIWYYSMIESRNVQKKKELYINNEWIKKFFGISNNNYFVIENKFNSISGTVMINREKFNDVEDIATLKIYGDDTLLKEINLNKERYKLDFTCDSLTSYNVLKFEASDLKNFNSLYVTNLYGNR